MPFSALLLCYNWSIVVNLYDQCVYFRSSVGNHFAKTRATIFAVIGFIFLAAGVGVTVGTLDLARNSGGTLINIYYVELWSKHHACKLHVYVTLLDLILVSPCIKVTICTLTCMYM